MRHRTIGEFVSWYRVERRRESLRAFAKHFKVSHVYIHSVEDDTFLLPHNFLVELLPMLSKTEKEAMHRALSQGIRLSLECSVSGNE